MRLNSSQTVYRTTFSQLNECSQPCEKMARARRNATRSSSRRQPTSTDGPVAADVYQEMLAEAGVNLNDSQSHPSAERPLKRRRRNQNDVQPSVQDDEPVQTSVQKHGSPGHGDSDRSRDAPNADPGNELPAPTLQTLDRDSDDDDDDDDDEGDIEFEDVAFEAWLKGDEPVVGAGSEPKDLEINISAHQAAHAPDRNTTRRKPMTREEKDFRVQTHQAHLLCLLSHVARRNHWCNDPKVQDSLRPHLKGKVATYLTPGSNLSQFGQSNSLKTGMGQAGEIWKNKFEITERGLRRALWAEDVNQLQDYEPPEDIESCHDREDFREAARTLSGSRDVSAQLYCAMMRSAGVRARLVCSLQPLACTSSAPTLPKTKPKTSKASAKLSKNDQIRASMAKWEEQSKAASAAFAEALGTPTARRRLGHPGAAAYNFEPTPAPLTRPKPQFEAPKRIRESPHPVYWVEVLDAGHQTWLPADPVVTHTFGRPKALEPPITDKENSMSYVIAFEADGTAKDVTRRYAKAYSAKTRRLRVETTMEGGDKWWRKALRPFRRYLATDLDQIEDTELASAEAREPMPRNIQDFKDHPVFALERHFRRNEVLAPKAMPSGTVGAGSRGPLEKVYRRKDVKVARSTDKWYRMGRVVKPNEIPPKWLPKKIKPRGFDARDEEETAGTPVYTLDQTELYEPPPVRSGRVPKNKFGNIDAYVPSMIPRGAIHIRHENASKAAHLLGVDYAPALTGFSFSGRHGTAVLSGIVVAEEYREALQAVLEGLETQEQEAEEVQRRLAVLRQWKRFLVALRIRERVWSGATEEERKEAEREAEQEAEMRDAPSDVTEEYDMEDGDDDGDGDYGGGGFLVE